MEYTTENVALMGTEEEFTQWIEPNKEDYYIPTPENRDISGKHWIPRGYGGSVYLIKLELFCGHILYKVGESREVKKRIESIKLNAPWKVALMGVRHFYTKNSSRSVEAFFKYHKYNDKLIMQNREWFNLSDNELAEFRNLLTFGYFHLNGMGELNKQ